LFCTDLVYMHARYYDPLIGRFVSADTIVPGVEDAKGGAAATIGAVLNHKLTMDFHEPDWVSAMKEEDDKQKEKHTEDADEKGSNSDQWGPANPQTQNRYAYALNNPVKYTDPTGHIFFVPLIAAAVVGFGSGVAPDVGLDYVTSEDKSKFDVGASVGNSVNDPWALAGAIPVVGWAGKGAKVIKAGGKVVSKGTKSVLKAGDVGSYEDLVKLGRKGDNLTPNHMPQNALGFLPTKKGGAIAMPGGLHAKTRTFGGKGKRTARVDSGVPFREVLAKDLYDLRSITRNRRERILYNRSGLNLIRWYRQYYPQLMKK
jgi:hypothetical protein